MKINMPNKALPYNILCGAAVLVFFLAACDAVDMVNLPYSDDFSSGESHLVCHLDSHDFMCPRASHIYCDEIDAVKPASLENIKRTIR